MILISVLTSCRSRNLTLVRISFHQQLHPKPHYVLDIFQMLYKLLLVVSSLVRFIFKDILNQTPNEARNEAEFAWNIMSV